MCDFNKISTVICNFNIYLKQACPTRGPRALCGPKCLSMWPDKKSQTYKLYEMVTKNPSDITKNTIWEKSRSVGIEGRQNKAYY